MPIRILKTFIHGIKELIKFLADNEIIKKNKTQ